MPTSTPADAARAERDAHLARLIQGAVAGHADAFEAFYDATLGVAMGLARRMLPPADVEETLADAYMRAWREAARFDATRSSALGWLLAVVRARALEVLRAHHANAGVSAGIPAEAAALTAGAVAAGKANDGAGISPPDLLVAVDASSRLYAALAKLPPRERSLLGLAYFRDYSDEQIGALTGIAPGSVSVSIRRAQQKLARLLASLTDGGR